MLKLFDLSKEQLNSKEFDSEGFYFCSDSGEIFLDSPRTGKRESFGISAIIIPTEDQKPTNPKNGSLYYVLSTKYLYLYSDRWIVVSCETITFYNIVVSGGKYILEDERIHSLFEAIFIPDDSISDLASNISVVCEEGKCTITLTSDYDIFGTLIIN